MYEQHEAHEFGRASTAEHMKKVYTWMFFALLITAVIALFVSSNFASFAGLLGGPGLFVLLIAELILVWVLAGRVHKMKPSTALALFIIYSVLNGVTLSTIFIVYTPESIANTFFITAAMFGALSVFGYTTKKDMSGLGTFFFMALIGLIIASIVNIFLASTGLAWLISIAGVLIFAGLTAYDTQMIKNDPYYRKHPVMGALNLYLDFINMFLHLLRFFGALSSND